MSGLQDMSFTSLIFCSVVASLEFFTWTYPGESAENLKWAIFLMPLRAFLIVLPWKNSAQLYDGTITLPCWSPTSWAWFIVADFCTTVAMSLRQPTLVTLNFLFNIPNPASGKNFVCPTGRKDRVIC